MNTEVALKQDTLDAQQMIKLHMQIVDAESMAKDNAADLGDRLIAKKAELKHGEFKPWIEANLTFSYRKPAEYMQVARAKGADLRTFDACTSIREVLDLGKQPKAPKPKLEPDRRRPEDQWVACIPSPTRGGNEGEREAAQEPNSMRTRQRLRRRRRRGTRRESSRRQQSKKPRGENQTNHHQHAHEAETG